MAVIKEIFKITKGKKVSIVFDKPIESSNRIIQIGDLRNDNNVKYTSETNLVFADEKDVIIAWDGANAGTIGFELKGIIGSTLARLSLKEDYLKKYNSNYLGYFLTTKFDYFQNTATGATIPHISKTALEILEVPLPDLETQNKIVAILDKAKAILDKREETIAKYDELLRATFLEMFGDPFFNKKDFPKDTLDNLCHFITKGTTPNGKKIYKTKIEDSIPYLKVYHIVNGQIDFLHNPSYINRETHNELNRSKVYPNDVLMNIVGPPLGKIGIVPDIYKEWNVNQAIVIFRTKERILPSYLLNVLQSKTMLSFIINQAVGVRQLNISLKQCRGIEIPVPPIELQHKFNRLFGKYNNLISKLNTHLVNSAQLVSSLSQQVFDERITIDVDAELEALINSIDLDKNDEENRISSIVNDVTFMQRLIDRLEEQEFEDKSLYDKAKYILFRVMKEEKNLVKQVFKENKVQLTLQNETT